LIFVVDDDRDIREAIQDTLEEEGFQVEAASDGAAALDRLRALPVEPCLVLLDLMMPVMDGWEFLAVRKTDPRLAAIPIAVISASRDLPEDVPCMAKPLSPAGLMNVVHAHCGD
jgi:CheY-like chemotaxis protein